LLCAHARETFGSGAETLGKPELIARSLEHLNRALDDPKLPAVKRVDTVKQIGKLLELKDLEDNRADGDELLREFIEDCKASALEPAET